MDHGQFLEILKSRFGDAKKVFDEKQQALQKAQVEFNQAAQELNSWQFAVAVEIKKQDAAVNSAIHPPQPSVDVTSPSASGNEVNKTDIVRQTLQQHPNGVTPAGLWNELRGRIEHRAYIYSTLKRLKDKGEVFERRGKYVLRPPVAQQESGEPVAQ